MQAAIADLEQAKQLNPNAIEPNLWLGKAEQLLNKFTEADAAFGEAVKLAEEQKLPERAMFLVEWTRNAALNKDLSDADRAKTVRERAEQLKAAPSVGGASSAKQAALIIRRKFAGRKTAQSCRCAERIRRRPDRLRQSRFHQTAGSDQGRWIRRQSALGPLRLPLKSLQ